eukprot:CFRG2864T1
MFSANHLLSVRGSLRGTVSRALPRTTIPLRFVTGHASSPETLMTNKLTAALDPSSVEVIDVSGGCGASYEVYVTSAKFEGLSMIKQHRMVNDILRDDVQKMHAIRIVTKKP